MMCITVHGTLKNKTRPYTRIKSYKVIAIPIPMYASDSDDKIRSELSKR